MTPLSFNYHHMSIIVTRNPFRRLEHPHNIKNSGVSRFTYYDSRIAEYRQSLRTVSQEVITADWGISLCGVNLQKRRSVQRVGWWHPTSFLPRPPRTETSIISYFERASLPPFRFRIDFLPVSFATRFSSVSLPKYAGAVPRPAQG